MRTTACLMPFRLSRHGWAARQAAGYTLVELLVVLTLMGILLGLALPSFQRLQASNAVTALSQDLINDLQYARSEAMKRGLSVTACASADPYTTCAANGQWGNGWIVFLDRDANTLRSQNAADGEVLLRVRQLMDDAPAVSIAGTGALTVPAVRFDRSGGSAPASLTAFPNNTSTDVIAALHRNLCISTTGRVRLTDPGVAVCAN